MIKNINENIEASVSIFGKAVAWASKGKYRAVYIVILIQALFILSPFLYALTIKVESDEFYDQKFEVSRDLNTVHGYQITLDYLDACLKSIDEKKKDWYCSRAKERYKGSSEKWPQNEVSEYLDNNLYEAMKIDVSHYIRSAEFFKNIRKEYPKNYILEVVYSKRFWLFLTIFSVTTSLFLLSMLKAGIAMHNKSRKTDA